MNLRLLFLLGAFCLLCFSYAADAAFVVKRTHLNETTKAITTTPKKERDENRRALIRNLRTIQTLVHHESENGNGRHRDTSGWEGIVAFCCGILGLVGLYTPELVILAVPAIIFGAIGKSHGKQHRGMATAGFVMGIVMMGLVLLFLLTFSLVLGWWW